MAEYAADSTNLAHAKEINFWNTEFCGHFIPCGHFMRAVAWTYNDTWHGSSYPQQKTIETNTKEFIANHDRQY